jgi:multidrug efflux pump subunit AcrA (membrane-fusion protein)
MVECLSRPGCVQQVAEWLGHNGAVHVLTAPRPPTPPPQVALSKAEAASAALQQQLGEAEARLAARDAELDDAKRQLEGREDELAKATAQVEERDTKVRGAPRGWERASLCLVPDAAERLSMQSNCEGALRPPTPPLVRPHPLPPLAPTSQIHEMEEVVRQSQRYSATLQSYNTRWGPRAQGARGRKGPWRARTL